MFLCWTAFRVNPGAHMQPSCFRLDIPYLDLKLSSYCLFFVSYILLVCLLFVLFLKFHSRPTGFFLLDIPYTFSNISVTAM